METDQDTAVGMLMQCTQRIRDLLIMCYINLCFAYLLTYWSVT